MVKRYSMCNIKREASNSKIGKNVNKSVYSLVKGFHF